MWRVALRGIQRRRFPVAHQPPGTNRWPIRGADRMMVQFRFPRLALAWGRANLPTTSSERLPNRLARPKKGCSPSRTFDAWARTGVMTLARQLRYIVKIGNRRGQRTAAPAGRSRRGPRLRETASGTPP